MGIKVTINGSLKIDNGTVSDTDVSDAIVAMEARTWFLTFISRHTAVTKIELEKT